MRVRTVSLTHIVWFSHRDDDVLPESLFNSIEQAAESVNAATQDGMKRAIIELLIPELYDPISGSLFPDEGDQFKLWNIARAVIEQCTKYNGAQKV